MPFGSGSVPMVGGNDRVTKKPLAHRIQSRLQRWRHDAASAVGLITHLRTRHDARRRWPHASGDAASNAMQSNRRLPCSGDAIDPWWRGCSFRCIGSPRGFSSPPGTLRSCAGYQVTVATIALLPATPAMSWSAAYPMYSRSAETAPPSPSICPSLPQNKRSLGCSQSPRDRVPPRTFAGTSAFSVSETIACRTSTS